MKKLATICSALLLVASLMIVCGTATSCKSEDTMYQRKSSKTNAVNSNYKVRGTTQRNKATYRSY